MLNSDAGSWKALGGAMTSLPLLKGLAQQEFYHAKGLVSPVHSPENHDNNKPSFLLIPGFTCNANVMARIGNELTTSYNVYYASVSRIDWIHKSLPEIATELKTEIKAILQKYETNGDLHIMGHSLGGIVELIALSLGTDVRVNRIIQLAAPNENGTPLGNLPGISRIPAIRDMQKGAHGVYLNNNFAQIDSVIAGGDNFVPPANQDNTSLRIPEGITADNHTIPKAEHTDLILNPKVIAEEMKLLGLKK